MELLAHIVEFGVGGVAEGQDAECHCLQGVRGKVFAEQKLPESGGKKTQEYITSVRSGMSYSIPN